MRLLPSAPAENVGDSIMQKIISGAYVLLLALLSVTVLGGYRHALAQTPPSYPLYCKGPLRTSSGGPFGEMTSFTWAIKGAGAQSPGSGQCAWADRGPRGSEYKPGNKNIICGELGPVANLAPGKYAEIGVFRNPNANNCFEVTQVVGMVPGPPFSSAPVLPQPQTACAHCNDGTCQCGYGTGAQLCASRGGADPSLGCQQQP